MNSFQQQELQHDETESLAKNAIISPQSICFSRIRFFCAPRSLVVLQQTYISCYLRCNFMFSRLLRILMFMFFFSFSSLTSFSLHNSLASWSSFLSRKSNEFDAIKNMFHKRITADLHLLAKRERFAIRQSAIQYSQQR